MGLLIEGEWVDRWYDTKSTGGRFKRQESQFRDWVTPDGSAGPGAVREGFKAEPNRYHLYVSYACPWAHRALIMRALKNLENIISVDVVHPDMLANGWELKTGMGATGDTVNGMDYLRQVYTKAKPDYTGRVTVPTLWDKQGETIVNNESAEILRMLNSAFDAYTDVKTDYYPEALRHEIDAINAKVYPHVNNGVYRAGFATAQAAYEEAFDELFSTLDELEARLGEQRYLVGGQITEADWRLFTTLIRFDAVYYSHFKCNRQRIDEFPNLSNYLRDLYQQPKVAATVRLDHIKRHYYVSQTTVNPTQIVPKGPLLDFDRPHDRDRFG